MKKYYVNDRAQDNGDHEVHVEGCYYLGKAQSVTLLGSYWNCREAVEQAKRIYVTSDGCAHCCAECHTR